MEGGEGSTVAAGDVGAKPVEVGQTFVTHQAIQEAVAKELALTGYNIKGSKNCLRNHLSHKRDTKLSQSGSFVPLHRLETHHSPPEQSPSAIEIKEGGWSYWAYTISLGFSIIIHALIAVRRVNV